MGTFRRFISKLASWVLRNTLLPAISRGTALLVLHHSLILCALVVSHYLTTIMQFSARMNAWVTGVAGTWLMGECEVNDVEVDGVVYKDQGLLVKRCRFLEESGCASVCVNSCKIPTQNFFNEDMGLPLTMTPDYETHECQFSFGLMPDTQGELDAKSTPCLSRCPSAGGMRKWHDGSSTLKQRELAPNACQMMDNDAEDESL